MLNTPPQVLTTPIPTVVRHEVVSLMDPVWLQEVQTRGSGTELVTTSTLPRIPVPELIRLQQGDPDISRLIHYNGRPTKRLLAKEPKGARKLLSCPSRVEVQDGVFHHRVMIGGVQVHQLILPKCLHQRVMVALIPRQGTHPTTFSLVGNPDFQWIICWVLEMTGRLVLGGGLMSGWLTTTNVWQRLLLRQPAKLNRRPSDVRHGMTLG